MNKPKIADTKPAVLDLKPGTYWWCACGESKEQPFCDGSHRGTGLSPIEFEVTEGGRVALCMCKRSEKGCYCDGTHNSL